MISVNLGSKELKKRKREKILAWPSIRQHRVAAQAAHAKLPFEDHFNYSGDMWR